MVNVLFLLVGIFIGAVVTYFIFIAVITGWYIGKLRMVFVENSAERFSLEFDDNDAKVKAQNKLRFGLVKIERKIIEDPDTQEIQGV